MTAPRAGYCCRKAPRKMLTGSAFLMMLLVLATPGFASSPIRVSLALEAKTALPGIPVGGDLVITNESDVAVEFPRDVAIVARPLGGAPFVAHVIGREQLNRDVLAARESACFDFRGDGTFRLPPWFSDPRINRPGTFELTVYAGGDLVQFGGGPNVTRVIAAADSVSNPATLTVVEPSGDDSAVWSGMKGPSEAPWASTRAFYPEALGAWIVERYPDSVYAGYFAATGFDLGGEARAARLRRWLERTTAPDPYREMRMLQVVNWETLVLPACGTAEFRAAKARAMAALKKATRGPLRSEAAMKLAAELAETVPYFCEE